MAASAHVRRRMTRSGTNEVHLLDRFFDKVLASASPGEVADLREVFDRTEGELYFDQVHCSDKGCELLARRLCEPILEEEGA